MKLRKKKSSSRSRSESSSDGGVLGRGYSRVHKAKKEQDANRANRGVYRFWLKKGSEAMIRFLTDEPVTFKDHTVPVKRGGQTRYDHYTCCGKGCPLCKAGNNARFIGAFLIVDRTKYKDKQGKKHSNSIRLLAEGTTVLGQLERKYNKLGLLGRDYLAAKTEGGGWEFEAEDKSRLNPPLEELLKEFDIKDPYAIVENSVKPLSRKALEEKFGDYDPDDDDEDDDDDEEDEKAISKKVRKFASL